MSAVRKQRTWPVRTAITTRGFGGSIETVAYGTVRLRVVGPNIGMAIIGIVMIEKPYSCRTAAFSNIIAFVFTGEILGLWYALITYTESTCFIIAFGFVLLVVELVYLDLESDANQWAPIAGASMIVGWTAVKTDFATPGGAWFILIGLLYSLWCIALATELRQSHKTSTFVYLSFSHLVLPAVIAIGFAHVANKITEPVPEKARQDACYTARVALTENQCNP